MQNEVFYGKRFIHASIGKDNPLKSYQNEK